jgi:hypothetical protein
MSRASGLSEIGYCSQKAKSRYSSWFAIADRKPNGEDPDLRETANASPMLPEFLPDECPMLYCR